VVPELDSVVPVVPQPTRHQCDDRKYAMEANAALVAQRRWSKARIARVDRRLPGNGKCVSVEPPLSCNGPSNGSVLRDVRRRGASVQVILKARKPSFPAAFALDPCARKLCHWDRASKLRTGYSLACAHSNGGARAR